MTLPTYAEFVELPEKDRRAVYDGVLNAMSIGDTKLKAKNAEIEMVTERAEVAERQRDAAIADANQASGQIKEHRHALGALMAKGDQAEVDQWIVTFAIVPSALR